MTLAQLGAAQRHWRRCAAHGCHGHGACSAAGWQGSLAMAVEHAARRWQAHAHRHLSSGHNMQPWQPFSGRAATTNHAASPPPSESPTRRAHTPLLRCPLSPCRPERAQAGEGRLHHPQAREDPLAPPRPHRSRGQGQGPAHRLRCVTLGAPRAVLCCVPDVLFCVPDAGAFS